MKDLKKVIANNWFLIKLCFKASPIFVILFIFEAIRNEVVVYLEFTFGLNYILECFEFGRPFRDAAVFLVALLAFVIAGLFFNAYLYQKIQAKSVPVIKKSIKRKLYNKAKEIDLSCYDNPEFYNDYILALSEAENQIDRTFTLLSKIFTGIVTFICGGIYFISKDPLSVVFIAFSFLLTIYLSKVINKLNVKLRVEKNPHERKLNYTNRAFYLNDYAKEIRLNTEAGDLLLRDFDETNNKLLEIERKYAVKRMWFNFIKNYAVNNFVSDVLYITYLVYNAVVLKNISYSSVAVMYGTANRTKKRLLVLSEVLPHMQETSFYVEKILKFLRLDSNIKGGTIKELPSKSATIELRNISFAYSEGKYALKNINMMITPYKKIAIVGYNGAGKTTLIKLIMRLYDPNEGEILLNGINIKEYDLESYRSYIGAIFQDYKIFAATLKENVILEFSYVAKDKKVINSLEKSGFAERLATLEDGLETHLTTEFEEKGINLSGGESQKVAISRAFYRESGLIILDEPSSALDPISEYHLNYSMLTAAEDKSVVFISHRLSTTRIADVIYMLQNGEIIESGTHTELLKINGKYSEMWQAQAGRYREGA